MKDQKLSAALAMGERRAAQGLLKEARDYIVSIGEHMWCTGSNTACIVCKITAFLGDVCPTRTIDSPELVWPEEKK